MEEVEYEGEEEEEHEDDGEEEWEQGQDHKHKEATAQPPLEAIAATLDPRRAGTARDPSCEHGDDWHRHCALGRAAALRYVLIMERRDRAMPRLGAQLQGWAIRASNAVRDGRAGGDGLSIPAVIGTRAEGDASIEQRLKDPGSDKKKT